MNETRQLARFVAETQFEDLPREVVERYKTFVLDNVCSGMVGSIQPWSNMIADMVRESECNGVCTVFGRQWRTGLSGAALVNGAMICGFEVDHSSALASAHPSGVVFPCAMAVAEAQHKDGKSFLTAMVLGYEALCRIGEAATRAVEDVRGFHGPGTNAPFGAAIAAGKLLGFDAAKLTNALGIAGSHSAGLMEFMWEGAMSKRLHLGRGAQMGLESALLANKGFTGPSTVLEGKFGFFNVFSPAPQPGRLLADLGTVWRGYEGVKIKPYACHGTHQSVMQAIDHFKAGHSIAYGDIRKVTVAGAAFMIDNHTDPAPVTLLGAQYSMVYGVAIALAKDIANPYVYSEETLWDQHIRGLAKRVEAVADPRFSKSQPNDPHAEIAIEMHDGQRHVIQAAGFKGLPATPFTFDDACKKLRTYAAPIVDQAQTEEIISKVRHLELQGDMAEIARLTGKP